MKTIQEMLQELSQCIVTVSGEFRFRTNWSGGKVPQPDLDTFDPNVPFCIENVGDVPAGVQYNTKNTNIKISKDYKTWNDYTSGTEIELNPKDRVYIKSDYVLDESATPKFNFTNANGTRLRARGNIASLIHGTNDAYVNKYTSTEEYCYSAMFRNCKSLVQVPDLPATTLADYCYRYMFNGCTSLTQAPELPATTLANYCYQSMFDGCTSLVQAPELPATTLATCCYDHMFWGCKSLTKAPELPATTLATGCYGYMLYDCKFLTQAPELPATTLASKCYESMFNGCASLVRAPELPATQLAEYCYRDMFKNCISLTQAPELPATILAQYCYYNMFSYCTKLSHIKCLATNTSATNCTRNWLYNVASTGTFECDNKKYFTIDSPNGIPMGWSITEINPDVEKPDLDTFDPNVPFCIENVGDVPVEVGLYDFSSSKQIRTNCKISYDNSTWQDYSLALTTDPKDSSISKINLVNKGDRVYIKADLTGTPDDYNHTNLTVLNESANTKIRVRGNIASINKGTNDVYKTDYLTADSHCYNRMFVICTSLMQAPELPAMTLNANCYKYMFWGCTSLTRAPELPATTLADYCYYTMFRECTSLTQAPELPAATLAGYCYYSMFRECTSLTQAPELPATTLAKGCYCEMFIGCTSLVQAPDLPATTLIYYGYNTMFSGCTKLNYVKCLATDTSSTTCTTNWLNNVSATGTFECDNKKYFTIDSPSGIPVGWTITEINPDPPTPPEPEKPDLDVFDPNVPFCIENVGDVPVEIGMYDVTSNIRNSCEISYNNKDWITYTLLVDPGPSDIEKITLSNKGDRVYIKANHPGTTMSPTPYTHIRVLNESTNTKIQARGNIASLTYAKDDAYKTDYYNTLPDACYVGLFMGCKSLVKAPDLPAVNLSKLCYMYMFSGCTNLKYIYSAAANLASNCTLEWVKGVASTGDFYAQSPAIVNWTTGDSGIPAGWTRHQIYSD